MFTRIVSGSILSGWRRTGLALAGVLVPAALLTAAANFSLDSQAKMTRELASSGPNVTLRPAAGKWIGISDAAKAKRRLGARVWLPRVEGVVDGIPVAGVSTRPPGTCRMSPYLSERLGGDDGRLTLRGKSFRIVESGSGNVVELPLEGAFAVLGEKGYSEIAARVPGDLGRIEAKGREVERAIPSLSIRPIRAIAVTENVVLKTLRVLFGVVGILVLVVAGVATGTALATRVAERRKEIAVFRALGGTPSLVSRLLVAEIATLFLLGTVCGAGIGIYASDLMARNVFGVSGTPRLTAILLAALGCLLMTAASAVWPLRRALSIEPAHALRDE